MLTLLNLLLSLLWPGKLVYNKLDRTPTGYRRAVVETGGYIVLTFEFSKKKNGWSGYCEELGTAVDGRTLPETRKLLKEFVELHLDSLEDIGERERFFRKHNIKLHRGKPASRVTVSMPLNDKVLMSSHIHELSEVSAN